MGEEIEISVDKILELNQATTLVENSDLLDAAVAYRVGRLGDFTSSIVKTFMKQSDKMQNETRRKQLDIQKTLAGLSDSEKAEKNEEMMNIGLDFTAKREALMEQMEKVKMPKFNLSDFTASEDKRNDKGEVIKKKGDLLVPTKFFTLMGEFVSSEKTK